MNRSFCTSMPEQARIALPIRRKKFFSVSTSTAKNASRKNGLMAIARIDQSIKPRCLSLSRQ